MWGFLWKKKDADPGPGVPPGEYVPEGQARLWDRIKAFSTDDPEAEYPFSRRLADECKWTREFALRAIGEYKKFLFLCLTCDHMVTPSVTVDKVWHLHLQYTKSYLEDLCVYTLGRLIHHHPSRGGKADQSKYERLYQLTLDAYARNFGEPPADIWGRRVALTRTEVPGTGQPAITLVPDGYKKGDDKALFGMLSGSAPKDAQR